VIHRSNVVTLIFGKKGGGKSTLARKLALAYPRRIYLDPMFEVRDGVIVKSYKDAVAFLHKVHGSPRFSIVLRTMDPEEELKIVALLTHGDPEHPVLPNTLLVMEELDRLCSAHDIPDPLWRLANLGRHFSVSFIGVARSPKSIHGDFRRAADVIYVGKLNEPSDVDYLNEYAGNEFCAKARLLSDYQFVSWPESEGGPPPT
jgi:hypothetical protein